MIANNLEKLYLKSLTHTRQNPLKTDLHFANSPPLQTPLTYQPPRTIAQTSA